MIKGIEERLNVFLKYKNLLRELVARDIKVRYRRSLIR